MQDLADTVYIKREDLPSFFWVMLLFTVKMRDKIKYLLFFMLITCLNLWIKIIDFPELTGLGKIYVTAIYSKDNMLGVKNQILIL